MYMLAVLCLVAAAVALPVDNLTPPPNLEGKVDNIPPVEDHGGKIEPVPYVDKKAHGSLKEPKELDLQGAKELPRPDDSKILDKPDESKKEDSKEPKKDADFKEPKKDADFKEPKKDDDFKEPKKDDDIKEPNKNDDIKTIEEHKYPVPDQSNNDNGNDKYPVVDHKKSSGLSGILNWIFNLFPFNPFGSSNGARSDFDDQPIIQYQVDPNDPDAINLLK